MAEGAAGQEKGAAEGGEGDEGAIPEPELIGGSDEDGEA